MKKRTKTSDAPEYSSGDKVIIFGGVIDINGLIESTIQVGAILEVGESDIMVSVGNFGDHKIVPKALCIPIKPNPETLINSSPLKPMLGDMVYFRGKRSWKDKDESILVGTVYEIAYAGGRPDKAKIHSGSEMLELDYFSLLVLQRNKG